MFYSPLGNVSTANNGGFTSIRTKVTTMFFYPNIVIFLVLGYLCN